MNGRRAKALRRMAEAATVGKPTASYTRHGRANRAGRYTVRLLPGCTRAVYQKFKKALLLVARGLA